MGSIGLRGALALLVLVTLACGGDPAEPGDAGELASAPEASEAETSEDAVARPAESLGAGDPDTTAPSLVSVQLQPDPPASGDLVRAVVRVEDGEGGYALHYLWEVAGRTFEDDSGAIQLPALRKGARVAVTVTAGNAAGVSESLSTYTEIENGPPAVLDLKVEEKFSGEGELEGWEAQAWARDPDGDDVELEYIWLLNDRPTEVETALYRTDSLKRGDRLRVRVLASDGEDESELAESGTFEIGNTAPVIESTPPRVDADGKFSYQIEVIDADGDRSFSYELVKGPTGMHMDRYRGMLTWQPKEDQAGKHPVEIAVEDRSGGRSSQSFLLPVVVKGFAGGGPANTP